MDELLHLGQLAIVLNDTLYVHGGLIGTFKNGESSALGHVPGRPFGRIADVMEWVHALNEWKSEQLREWRAEPLWRWDSAHKSGRDFWTTPPRGGHLLMDYVVPGCEPSVVMARHLQKSGMPELMPSEMVDALNAQGITRLVVGHTPHGTCPTVVKQGSSAAGDEGGGGDGAFEVIMCDTSFSDLKAPDNRGAAISSVVIHPEGFVSVKGVLADGQGVAYTLGAGVGPEDEYVGRIEPSYEDDEPTGAAVSAEPSSCKRFVKARLESGKYLLCNVSKGFLNQYWVVPEETVKARFAGTYEMASDRSSNRVSIQFAPPDQEGLQTQCEPANRRAFVTHIFNSIDKDKSGTIEMSELHEALHGNPALVKLLAGIDNKPPDVEQLIGAMDQDKTGTVSLTEFLEYWNQTHDSGSRQTDGGLIGKIVGSVISPLKVFGSKFSKRDSTAQPSGVSRQA